MDFITSDIFTLTVRLFVAALLCGVIGFEREAQQQPAGFRTHLLVGMSSCLMMVMALQGFTEYMTDAGSSVIRMDPTRIPAYVISGIGFLGAGTIIVQHGSIRGLTTAASIWTAAGIGLVVGVGMYYAAVLATIISVLALYVFKKLENRYMTSRKIIRLSVVSENIPGTLDRITALIRERKIPIKDFSIDETEEENGRTFTAYVFTVKSPGPEEQIGLIRELEKTEGVRRISK
ncbi:MgtC/SapB family protein [Indiicoccus explosivorum]|uniref:MgtC/SapB family protein n=1 Tax=Indiicoccus explosivorum TaxID=1917864 RepID=UPI000B434CDD|nr:MgtC/SapB family protein [Indiicoccus explosivorum]